MADTTCSKRTAWYSCASGFRGCCSVDPCGLEICPDDSNGPMTKSALTAWSTWTERPASASTLTTLSKSRSSTTPEAASTTEFESLTRNNAIKAVTSSVTERATITPTITLSELGAQPTPASNLVSSSHRLSSTMIGAIVGGVISLVLILCLIAYFIHRTRKKRGRKVRRQFTLLRWRHHCLEDKQMSLEQETGTATPGTMDLHAQAKGQPPLVRFHDIVIGSGSRTGFMNRQKQPQTIPGEQSPVVSLLQKRETDSPGSIPSALTSSPSPLAALQPAISPKTSLNLQSAFTPTPPLPAAIHPALHPGQGEHGYHPTAYWPSSCTPEMSRCNNANIITDTAYAHADAHEQPHSRHFSTTPELFDTGFYLGRVELPTTCSRELINIPFAERQRQRQKSQLHRGTAHPLSITTPDGAVLSPNFNGLPVDIGAFSHALSSPYSQEPGPVEPRPEKRASEEQKEIQKQKHKHKLLPLNLLPPLPLPPSPSRPPLTSSTLSSGLLSSPTPSSSA
ncbi:hypothetical protein BDW60DRAFT_204381 [Aspergillus nidulans var. acristatus]